MTAPDTIVVRADDKISGVSESGVSKGVLHFQGRIYHCALGRSGLHAKKAEGDGVSPIGTYPLRSVLYRPDRTTAPDTALPAGPIKQNSGWCDDPTKPSYNKAITFPFDGNAEHLWRDDHLYDVIVVLGHNDDPIVAGAGSAIFMHVAGEGYPPTEGCVALAMNDLLDVLSLCSAATTISLQG
jgi:L,D-peptidoglycan transpeptidase YkuD (ErfK/YbiS/YcfS/YnhG family)